MPRHERNSTKICGEIMSTLEIPAYATDEYFKLSEALYKSRMLRYEMEEREQQIAKLMDAMRSMDQEIVKYG